VARRIEDGGKVVEVTERIDSVLEGNSSPPREEHISESELPITIIVILLNVINILVPPTITVAPAEFISSSNVNRLQKWLDVDLDM
jgi:hypothetical protein